MCRHCVRLFRRVVPRKQSTSSMTWADHGVANLTQPAPPSPIVRAQPRCLGLTRPGRAQEVEPQHHQDGGVAKLAVRAAAEQVADRVLACGGRPGRVGAGRRQGAWSARLTQEAGQAAGCARAFGGVVATAACRRQRGEQRTACGTRPPAPTPVAPISEACSLRLRRPAPSHPHACCARPPAPTLPHPPSHTPTCDAHQRGQLVVGLRDADRAVLAALAPRLAAAAATLPLWRDFCVRGGRADGRRWARSSEAASTASGSVRRAGRAGRTCRAWRGARGPAAGGAGRRPSAPGGAPESCAVRLQVYSSVVSSTMRLRGAAVQRGRR